MKNYKNSILILLFITFSGVINAQLNYKEGYIITLKNDTVFGLIHDGGGIRNSKVCLFKADKKSKVLKYYPKEIKSYKFIGDKYYCSKELIFNNDSNFVFSEVLLDGKIKLYFSWENKEYQFLIEKDAVETGLINKKVVLPISPESLYGLQNTKIFTPVYSEKSYNQTGTSVYVDIYKDTLLTLFKDSEITQNQIPALKYNQKSLINFSKGYLKETCYGDDCISYEKDYSILRPRFGVYAGSQLRKNIWETKLKSELFYSIPIGVFYNFPLKHFNDRLSFQIELTYNNINHNQLYPNLLDTIQYMVIKSSTIGVPLLLKYEFSGNKVKPTFAIGKEIGFGFNSNVIINNVEDLVINKTQKGGWFCEIGLDYKIGPDLSVFTNIRIQSFKNIIQAREFHNAGYSDAVRNDLFIAEYKTDLVALHLGIKF